jgi:hypothetical protein
MKPVCLFLHHVVVSGNVKTLAVVRFQAGIGRFGTEPVEVGLEVIMKNDEPVVGLGMFVEARSH